MRTQYGTRVKDKPEGMLREVIFPTLALTDVRTPDGRILDSAGGGTRDLPLTVFAQFVNEPGHSAAVIAGRLDYVVFEDDGNVSGGGWLIDDDNGLQALRYLKTQSLRGNSVDLADARAVIEWDDDNDDILFRFSEWNIGATTLVARPAFAEAHALLGDEEELVASWRAETEPIVIDIPPTINVVVNEPEITAAGAPRPSWDLFHVPEADKLTKLAPAEEVDGYIPVSGHLASWESCHDGVEGKCLMVPRPEDNYASFNKPGVLTDRGMVSTGPIFLVGGHTSLIGAKSVEDAYGGIENAWADVKIIPGRLGPWCSGYVRPGVPDELVIAARASRISGHWLGSRLKAIVSVNAEGYDVPGDGFTIHDGEVVELVAGFPGCTDEDLSMGSDGDDDFSGEEQIDELLARMEFDDMRV